MKQLKITEFFKPKIGRRFRPRRFKSKDKKQPQKIETQKLITDYWDEFTRIPTMSFFELYTPYKSSEEFFRTFFRKNWR